MHCTLLFASYEYPVLLLVNICQLVNLNCMGYAILKGVAGAAGACHLPVVTEDTGEAGLETVAGFSSHTHIHQ